jgi:hypothetical protein
MRVGLAFERTIAALMLALIVSLPERALAHDGADGEDVGHAHLTATQTNGVVTVELRISEAESCHRFAVRGLAGRRAAIDVTGAVAAVDECLIGGQLTLTEPGRWTMTLDLAYDDYPIAMTMPVGMSDGTTIFERTEWLHAPAPIPDHDHGFMPQVLIYASYVLTGLLPIALIEIVRRRRASRATE